MKIVIIDYGMGNLYSIKGVLKYIGIEDILFSSDPDIIYQADRLILPGVGSFAEAIQIIRNKKLDIYLQQAVLVQKKPILGICLGFQLLASSSNEHGKNTGLGFIASDISRFPDGVKIPHVGFNQVVTNSSSKLFYNMPNELDFYFVHSYRMPITDNINASICNYENETFVASFEKDNILGAQFHPELSQTNGIKLFKNFIEKF